jgi:hypothetical protein
VSGAPDETRLRDLLARVAVAPVLLAFCILAARSWFVCDDAYISFRYMRNWANGLGLRFNDTGPVVEGFSNPAWVALGTAARLVGLDETRLLPALCLVSALLLIAGASAWVVRRRGAGIAAWTTLALLAVNPSMAVWASSGLETMPYALTWFAVLVAWFDRWPVLARVALSGLLVASRPEGFLWAGVIAALSFPVRRAADGSAAPVPSPGPDRPAERAWLRAVVGTVAAMLVLLAVRYAVFGDLVANTAYAKGDTGAWYYVRGVQYVVGASIEVVLPALAFPIVLANLRDALVNRRWDRTAALSVAAAGHYGFAVMTGGDYMAFGRFLVAGLPLCAILVGEWLEDALAPRRAVVAILAAALVSLLPHFNVPLVPAFAREGALNYRRVAGGMPHERAHMELERDDGVRNERAGRMLRQVLQSDESLYQTAIGRVGYFGHANIIDRCYLVERMPPGVVKSRDKKPGHDSCVMSLTPRELAARKAVTNFDVVSVPEHAREEGAWSVGYPLQPRQGGAGQAAEPAVAQTVGILRTYYPAWEMEPDAYTVGQYFIVDRYVETGEATP